MTLELAKLALLRTQDDMTFDSTMPPCDWSVSIRLTTWCWVCFRGRTSTCSEQFLVPRALLSEIEADADDWAPLRKQLSEGAFVDIQRVLMVPADA